MKTAIDLIAEERKRQIEVEGFTPEHDDEYNSGELMLAAGCYAFGSCAGVFQNTDSILYQNWPWSFKWWKPTPEDRIREIVKAGALIVAEIERLQRIKQKLEQEKIDAEKVTNEEAFVCYDCRRTLPISMRHHDTNLCEDCAPF